MSAVITLTPTTDREWIARMAEEIWWVHYPPIIGEEQVRYMLQLFYSEDALQRQMDEGQMFLRIDCNGEGIGFLAYSEKEPGIFFIHKWYILKALQGKGIGREVFRLWLDNHPALRYVSLQVNRNNVQAICFYERVGFLRERELNVDIGGGFFMEDYLMGFSAGQGREKGNREGK